MCFLFLECNGRCYCFLLCFDSKSVMALVSRKLQACEIVSIGAEGRPVQKHGGALKEFSDTIELQTRLPYTPNSIYCKNRNELELIQNL
ncbi:hypothetical protein GUJ93_ZPchr0011g28136 [Zizania palustris]|uniref:Uncharacterized protein n=1 Tax=Zizania palustris TaxID=103762 RepID=A0A8J5WI77_ZIZPA|nr:hypothetical protein GUJ93_ZPchr0011g28136 [Zizania palustris]